jgi:hypothetical protein
MIFFKNISQKSLMISPLNNFVLFLAHFQHPIPLCTIKLQLFNLRTFTKLKIAAFDFTKL